MKKIDPKEFMEHGYLQELNRQFLHPLGMALAVQIDDDGTVTFDSIWDSRDDPEGFLFSEETLDPKKKVRVTEEQEKKFKTRRESLGYIAQPSMLCSRCGDTGRLFREECGSPAAPCPYLALVND